MDHTPKTSPSVDNYMIGKGILSIALITNGTPGNFADVGNCPKFEFDMTESVIDHKTSRYGLMEQDAETVIESGYTLAFTLDEVSVENLRMFMKGTLSGTKIIYANQNVNQQYAVKFIADNPVGPNALWEFHKCKLTPSGAFSLISQEYTSMSFNGKGLSDRTGHATSPFLTVTFDTSTTTTTTAA